MTDNMDLLRKAVDADGQAAVARRLRYSPSAINQALKGTYAGSLDNLLRRVAETYGHQDRAMPGDGRDFTPALRRGAPQGVWRHQPAAREALSGLPAMPGQMIGK